MRVEIKVPHFPESVEDGTLITWFKQQGEPIGRDEKVADIETDKVVLEVIAPQDGVLTELFKNEGDTVLDDEVIATLDTETVVAQAANATPSQSSKEPREMAPPSNGPTVLAIPQRQSLDDSRTKGTIVMGPAARKLAAEKKVDPNQISGSGKGGRITKADILQASSSTPPTQPVTNSNSDTATPARVEERVPMTRLRARIADRLVEAQQTAAILTTFNEVNMQPVMELRNRYKESFQKRYNVKLGFMSFFVKATVEALRQFPIINASVEEKDILYHSYYDIGMAISAPRGLLVPVIRDVDQLSFAEIEAQIVEFANRAREGQLTLEELTGGTFTITNGGVFGSMLSTPILNPPQSAILGLHKIQERAIVEKGGIVIKPMMYLALSYDHRIIDGRDAVQSLVAIKEALEDPARLLLQI